jgi:hypothetical protein
MGNYCLRVALIYNQFLESSRLVYILTVDLSFGLLRLTLYGPTRNLSCAFSLDFSSNAACDSDDIKIDYYRTLTVNFPTLYIIYDREQKTIFRSNLLN